MPIQERRGQAAMESLMTYGWGILAVIAAIAALAYFGVLSPGNYLPGKCILEQGFNCADYDIRPDITTIVVVNSLGRDLALSNVSIGNCQLDLAGKKLPNGAQIKIDVPCQNQVGQVKADIRIHYIDESTGVDKFASGTLQGKTRS